ncbi:MAG: ABC transporter ATP-binding protein [Gammaproteobacteria bacterium]
MHPVLEVKNLQLVLKHKDRNDTLVHNVSFTLCQKETVALIGESGSGKSLTALSLLQLLPSNIVPTQGSEAWYKGNNLFTVSERTMTKLRGKDIAIIFQEPMTSLNPVLTLGKQLFEVLKRHKTLSRKASKQRIYELLAEVGLSDPAHICASYPHQLSGGMKQRVMIAMALLCEPDILIADEATTALDVTVQAQILSLLQSLQQRYGMALLFITHDLGIARHMAHALVVMQQGRTVEQGAAAEFFAAPKTAYSHALLAASPQLAVSPTFVEDENKQLLQVENIGVHFPVGGRFLRPPTAWIKAVDDVSFCLQEGETLGIVGESGSGKSTLAKALVNLLPITVGTMMWRGIRGANTDVQMIFQDPYSSMNPRMMIVDLLLEGLRAQGVLPKTSKLLEMLSQLLEQVGMDSTCLYRYPHEFSGGQRQRLCIARALTLKPKVLICDEPTSALDVMTQQQVIHLLKTLQKQWNIAYIFISHDLAVVSQLAHRVMVMQKGRVMEYGAAQQVLHQPRSEYSRALLGAML